MITIKNRHALQAMEVAGKLLAELFVELEAVMYPGITTLALDSVIDAYLDKHKLISQSRGYGTYRHVSCISINDEVVHGVPSIQSVLCSGDLVKVDVCASYKGYCADMARCFFVDGVAAESARSLVDVAYRSLDKGIEQVIEGQRLTNISHAIQVEVERHGYGVVRDFAGHGIGRRMHEDPEILNYGAPGRGPVMRVGMAFAIEPMITCGDYRTYVADDGWTAKTVDGSLAAHVEDTVILTEHGPRIITRL